MDAESSSCYHHDLKLANELAYAPSGMKLESMKLESESQEYGATTFTVMNKKIKFRVAKITPTKVGHFVAIWKRENGITKPHDIEDPYDFFVISALDKDDFGQFIFNKSALLENKLITSESTAGKRGVRLYPSWVKAPSKQSKKSQELQCKSFIEIDCCNSEDYPSIVRLIREG
jgi:hypothetical protein